MFMLICFIRTKTVFFVLICALPTEWLNRLDKSIQINGNTPNGKRRITDWKSVGMANPMMATTQKSNENGNELVLPNCPGATISPKKVNHFNTKKKLSTLGNIYQESNSFLLTPVNW